MHQAMSVAKIKYSSVCSAAIIPEGDRIIFPFKSTSQLGFLYMVYKKASKVLTFSS